MYNKQKILIITPYFPYPLNSGGNLAQYTFLKELIAEFDIYLIAPISKKNNQINEFKKILPEINYIPFIESNSYKIKRLINKNCKLLIKKIILKLICTINRLNDEDKSIALNSTIIKSRSNYLDEKLIKLINKTIYYNKIQTIQIEFFEFIELGKFIPKTIYSIFVHHELRFIRENREINLLNNVPNFLKTQINKNNLFEIECLKKYNRLVTLSDIDKNELEKLKINNVTSSPIPFTSKFENIDNFNFNNTFTFLGGEDHFPNKDGIEWFIKECWSKINDTFPKTKLIIIGKWSNLTINKLGIDKSVEFVGFVPDLKNILKNSIFIVPIRIGSGIRMKIIEAISGGCPIITTTIGIEGLKFNNEFDIIIADNSDEFIFQTKRLITNNILCDKLIVNSQNTLKKNYSKDILIKKRMSIYL
jgi:glycosyltransferase involved in cell wall biosynthesis